ncbi:MAG: NusA-like transcription termination signal-binding factor [Candidatus Altiarchaeota archaeon]
MSRIRLGLDEIQIINLFEKMTGAKAVDIVHDDNYICFLVNKEDMGLAIGKKGSNITKARNKLGKNIHVVEYSDDYGQFIRNIFQPAEIMEVRISSSSKGRNVVVKTTRRDRKIIIGPGGEKINMARKLIDRHFELEDIIIETV